MLAYLMANNGIFNGVNVLLSENAESLVLAACSDPGIAIPAAIPMTAASVAARASGSTRAAGRSDGATEPSRAVRRKRAAADEDEDDSASDGESGGIGDGSGGLDDDFEAYPPAHANVGSVAPAAAAASAAHDARRSAKNSGATAAARRSHIGDTATYGTSSASAPNDEESSPVYGEPRTIAPRTDLAPVDDDAAAAPRAAGVNASQQHTRPMYRAPPSVDIVATAAGRPSRPAAIASVSRAVRAAAHASGTESDALAGASGGDAAPVYNSWPPFKLPRLSTERHAPMVAPGASASPVAQSTATTTRSGPAMEGDARLLITLSAAATGDAGDGAETPATSPIASSNAAHALALMMHRGAASAADTPDTPTLSQAEQKWRHAQEQQYQSQNRAQHHVARIDAAVSAGHMSSGRAFAESSTELEQQYSPTTSARSHADMSRSANPTSVGSYAPGVQATMAPMSRASLGVYVPSASHIALQLPMGFRQQLPDQQQQTLQHIQQQLHHMEHQQQQDSNKNCTNNSYSSFMSSSNWNCGSSNFMNSSNNNSKCCCCTSSNSSYNALATLPALRMRQLLRMAHNPCRLLPCGRRGARLQTGTTSHGVMVRGQMRLHFGAPSPHLLGSFLRLFPPPSKRGCHCCTNLRSTETSKHSRE